MCAYYAECQSENLKGRDEKKVELRIFANIEMDFKQAERKDTD
jgi:hypothetical protein